MELFRELEEMRRVLEEKNAQIEMIARTTTGGLKGSIDDAFYTYYYVSDGLCSMLGYTRDEFMEMSGGTAVGAVYPPDLEAALASVAVCFAKGPEYRAEYRIRKKDGSLIWVQDSGCKVQNADGRTTINSIISDISELKETMNRLKIEQERYETVAELSADIIFEYDIKTDVLEQFFPASLKRPKQRVITNGLKKSDVMSAPSVHPKDVEKLRAVLCGCSACAEPDSFETAEFRQMNAEGEYHWYRIRAKKIRDAEGTAVKTVGKVEDVHNERQLLMEARTDVLTGACNRSYLNYSVEEYLKNKSQDVLAAYLLIDIDHFKAINDTYGHVLGDKVLIGLVKRMKKLFRQSDLKARLGGDEFVVFMKDIYSTDLIREKAGKLQEMFYELGRHTGIAEEITLSIGYSVVENKSGTDLYKEADIALYHAKAKGRNCCCMYREGMHYPFEKHDTGI